MALRARLVAPPPPPREEWNWHEAKWGAVSSARFLDVGRRLEAESYLSSGFGIRAAIEARAKGWQSFGSYADVWMPGRLKGIRVDSDDGTPFLASTQVYDLRPAARKWLAVEKTPDVERRYVTSGMILVTCSGTVGRPTMAYAPHEGILISHDLLRVTPKEDRFMGWIYAFLHSPQARAMATTAQYGHIIKHLEVSHLAALPVPDVEDGTAESFQERASKILALRNQAYALRSEADGLFASAVGTVAPLDSGLGFEVRASNFNNRRLRLEACYHRPEATSIFRNFKKWERLGDVTDRVWWMSRFKRFYGDGGIPYLSANDLFTINPPEAKRILVNPDDNHEDYFVEPGWIIMACSGQVYGLNGEALLMTKDHEGTFFSHDLIRISPKENGIRSGFLLVALTHRTHGRPLLIRAAYGTSIPHLDPGDVADFPVVRLGKRVEGKIADLAEASVEAMAQADRIELEIATEAGEIIERFMRPRLVATTDPKLTGLVAEGPDAG